MRFAYLLAAVSETTGIDVDEIVLSRSRRRHIIDARVAFAALAIENGHSVTRVSAFLRRERSVVRYYVSQHNDRSGVRSGGEAFDPLYRETVESIRKMAKVYAQD